jgi:hypothetical protein
MKITTKDVVDFLKDNIGSWERAACFFEQMSATPAGSSAQNESLWRLQGAIYIFSGLNPYEIILRVSF